MSRGKCGDGTASLSGGGDDDDDDGEASWGEGGFAGTREVDDGDGRRSVVAAVRVVVVVLVVVRVSLGSSLALPLSFRSAAHRGSTPICPWLAWSRWPSLVDGAAAFGRRRGSPLKLATLQHD